jgi:hypothetical protein
MITGLETAVLEYLSAKLTADATLSALTYEVRSATDPSPMESNGHAIVVRMRDAPRTFRRLIDCRVEIIVGTHADVIDTNVAGHKLLEAAVEKAWDKDTHASAETELSARITANAPDYEGGGFYSEGWEQGRDETRFLPSFIVHIGVVKS